MTDLVKKFVDESSLEKIQALHIVLFGNDGKDKFVKRNILYEFKGFSFSNGDRKFQKRLEKIKDDVSVQNLKEIAEAFNVQYEHIENVAEALLDRLTKIMHNPEKTDEKKNQMEKNPSDRLSEKSGCSKVSSNKMSLEQEKNMFTIEEQIVALECEKSIAQQEILKLEMEFEKYDDEDISEGTKKKKSFILKRKEIFKLDEDRLKNKIRLLKKKLGILQKETEEANCNSSESYYDYAANWVKNNNATEKSIADSTDHPAIGKRDIPYPDVSMRGLSRDMQYMFARQSAGNTLGIFDGSSCLQWPGFYSAFQLSTETCGFSPAENVLRLNNSLKGEARAKVELLLVTAKEPDEILQILNSIYGKPILIARELVRRAENLNKVQNLQEFESFSYHVRNIASALSTIDSEDINKKQLLGTLISKLPSHLTTQWGSYLIENQIEDKKISIAEFSRWTKKMAQVISNITFKPSDDSSQQIAAQEKPKDMGRLPKDIKDKKLKRCNLCQDVFHSFDACKVFKQADTKKRWEIATKYQVCFCCLTKHMGKCQNRKICGINDCSKTHHRLLHKTRDISTAEMSMATQTRSEVILQFVSVKLRGPKGEISTVAFLDGGSTATLLDTALADLLGLEGPNEPLCCRWTADMFRYDQESRIVNIEIEGIANKNSLSLKNVRTVKDLRLPGQSWDVEELQKRFPYIIQADLTALKECKPMILIGQNNADVIVSRQTIQPQTNSPILSKTALGWTVHGPTGKQNIDASENVFTCCEYTDENLHAAVKHYFSIENFGVTPSNKNKSLSMEVVRAEKIAESTIKYKNQRYEIGYPWKSDDKVMVEGSKQMAFQRLKCLERKLRKNQKLGNSYAIEVEKLLQKGYAKQVSVNELENKKRVWYLPHFAVLNPKKPDKVRMVFDAAAKVNGMSLNDYILTGPDWLVSLFGILLRFRKHAIAFSADIAEMFNRVEIIEDDTYAQCFLWRNLRDDEEPTIFRMKAMFFGSVAAPFLAQFVKNYNANKFSSRYPKAARAIVRDHYVDDYLHGADTEEEAIQMINNVRLIHSEGGFELRKFISNSAKVLENIPIELRANIPVTDVKDKLPDHRVLGILWKAEMDCLAFSLDFTDIDVNLTSGKTIPTKRQVLKIVMSIFDPLGFLSPVTVRGRILLQIIWRSGIGWDDFISKKMFEEWKNYLSEVQKIKNISIPRLYSKNLTTAKAIQLHTFCDASEEAYSAVSYLRIENHANEIETVLVASKARVAPLRSLTIPKLELMAAVLGARLSKSITDELEVEINKKHFWSDSKTVLQWLNSEKKLQSFASARVGEILDLTEVDEWKWVPTNLNVADDCTRNTTITNFDNNHRWFYGPDVLKEIPSNWPKLKDMQFEIIDLIMTNETDHSVVLPLPRMKFNYSWIRILRTTAWLKRYIDNLLAKHRNTSTNFGPLTVPELEWAERKWWAKVQQEKFPFDLQNTMHGRKNKNGRMKKENLLIDGHEILRISGRICENSIIPFDMKNPICLCARHPYVEAMIKHLHRQFGHQGHDTVINELRKKFHIPKIRVEVKRIIGHCLFCKKLNSKPEQPIMGKIPEDRFQFNQKPFTVTGVDYFGPIEVKEGRKIVKRYGVLFTCLTSRAIHVEVAHSLTTDSCILAIRRFLCRRGHVKKFWSDNGTNLKAANEELRKALASVDEERLRNSIVNSGIDWQFIPPGAPHMGGSWERLIKSFKRAMGGILKEKRPNDEVLKTVFCEAEYIVNSRPLTYPSTQTGDLTSLSPNDILILNSCVVNSPGKFTKDDEILRKQWRYAQYISEQFWKRWLVEYVPSLVSRKKWTTHSSNLKEGELVLIGDKNLPRLSWPIGIITKTYYGEDGIVRVADVKAAKGEYRRPATKLHRLDIDCTDNKESVRGGRNVAEE